MKAPHTRRFEQSEVYEEGFLDKLIAGKGLEEARKRIQVGNGHYHYEPSPEYKRMIAHKIPLIKKKH